MLEDGTPCDKSAPGAVKHVTGGAAAKGANSGFGGERGRRQWRREAYTGACWSLRAAARARVFNLFALFPSSTRLQARPRVSAPRSSAPRRARSRSSRPRPTLPSGPWTRPPAVSFRAAGGGSGRLYGACQVGFEGGGGVLVHLRASAPALPSSVHFFQAATAVSFRAAGGGGGRLHGVLGSLVGGGGALVHLFSPPLLARRRGGVGVQGGDRRGDQRRVRPGRRRRDHGRRHLLARRVRRPRAAARRQGQEPRGAARRGGQDQGRHDQAEERRR